MTADIDNICTGCGRHRQRYERWSWLWSDEVVKVIAAYCRTCANERGLRRGDHKVVPL